MSQKILFLLYFLELITISKADFKISSARISQFHNEISTFVDEFLSTNLNNCNVVHFRNYKIGRDEQSGQLTSVGTLPVIEMNFHLMKSDKLSSFFDNFDKNQISRHGRQCKIYLIRAENPDITKIFVNPALQVQAHQSYVIFLGQSEVVAEQILLSPNLQNYKHRVWLEIQGLTKNQGSKFGNFGIVHHYFCYTCGEGAAPALVATPSANKLFPDTTKNLNGRTLICTAPQAPPLVAIKDENGKKFIVGMQSIILKEMAKKMNFTFNLKRASGGATGIPLPNGTWTGIMGEILSSEADIGLSVSTSYERNKILDFTVPVFHAFLVLVSVKPLPHFAFEAIFYPFDQVCWAAIFISMILTVMCYKFLHDKSKLSSKSKNKLSMFNSTYLAIGALLEQGVPFKLTSTPSRLYAGFWFLLAIVVTCAYRSKLFMFLTFPTIEKPPSTFQELSISDYSWGMKSLGGVGLLLITKSPLAYIRHIGEHLELSFDKYSCLDKTFTHKFVCIIYRAYIDYTKRVRYWNVDHKFHVSDYVTSAVGSSWVLPKYSPLLPILDKYHFSQFEMGLANKYVGKYQEDVAMEARALAQVSNSSVDTFPINTNYVREEDGPKPLQFGNLGGAFFILFFGLVVAAAIFLAEVINNYRKKTFVKKARRARIKKVKFVRTMTLK